MLPRGESPAHVRHPDAGTLEHARGEARSHTRRAIDDDLSCAWELTETPFELVGAPWIREHDLAGYLNRRRIPGVRFTPAQFTPRSSAYAKELCRGVQIEITARNALDSPELGIELAAALEKLYPQQHKMDRMPLLLGNQSVFEAIKRGDDPRRIARSWQGSLKKFKRLRQRYLLYR